MDLRKKWKNFVKIMFTGKYCPKCGTYDSILISEEYPRFHYKCPNCGYRWVEVDSLFNQWINKLRKKIM